MALIWADFPSNSQGLYGTERDRMLDGVWAALEGNGGSGTHLTLVSDPDPSIGASGTVLRVSNNTFIQRGARFALPAGPTQKVGIACRLWVSALPAGDWNPYRGPLLAFRTAANVDIANITVLSNGGIGVARTNENVDPYGSTSVPVITANSWNHIEIALDRSDTIGTIEVRVNAITVLELTGLNLGLVNTGQVFVGTNDHNGNINNLDNVNYYKDIIFWDGTGTQNNDFLGSVAVIALRPDSDNSFNWTASSGSTGFNLIDEAPPVDTDFISASDALPAASTFNLQNLPPDIVSVKGLIPISRARKIDGGDGNLQMGLVGTLTDLGANKAITTAFTYHWDVSELSPDTGAPWTPVEVDAVKLQVNRTL